MVKNIKPTDKLKDQHNNVAKRESSWLKTNERKIKCDKEKKNEKVENKSKISMNSNKANDENNEGSSSTV